MDDMFTFYRLEMEPYDRPVTTIIWFHFRGEPDSDALNRVLSEISEISSWENTFWAFTEPTSNERIAFISMFPVCNLHLKDS